MWFDKIPLEVASSSGTEFEGTWIGSKELLFILVTCDKDGVTIYL